MARRTTTTSGRCGTGLEGRREQVAAKGGGAPCVINWQEARSSSRIKRSLTFRAHCCRPRRKRPEDYVLSNIFKIEILEACPGNEQPPVTIFTLFSIYFFLKLSTRVFDATQITMIDCIAFFVVCAKQQRWVTRFLAV